MESVQPKLRRVTISLRPQGPFSLPAPVSVALTDDGGEPVAFRAVWTGSVVDVDFVSDLPPTRVEAHAARVLSLEVYARDLALVGDRDPVILRSRAAMSEERPPRYSTVMP